MKLLVGLLVLAGSLVAQTPNLSTEEFEKYMKQKNVFLLDVREPKELTELGTLKGYVNIPVGELEKRLSEIPKGKLIVTFCNKGVRASRAADILTKAGYKVAGACGLSDYKEKGKKLVYPKEKKS